MRSTRIPAVVSLVGGLSSLAVALGGDWNDEVLRAVRAMPKGGGYSVSSEAGANFRAAVTARSGELRVDARGATPSYCSSATYLVLTKVLAEAQREGRIRLGGDAVAEIAPSPQADGVGVWGRWNANGPGAARLVDELGAGRNFTDFAAARPGDFLKIFWRDAVGRSERGHLVVFLGMKDDGGVPVVRFWSSNKPGGYGEKSVKRSEIARAIFTRLEDAGKFAKVAGLPREDGYLSKLLERESSFVEACRMVGATERP